MDFGREEAESFMSEGRTFESDDQYRILSIPPEPAMLGTRGTDH